MLMFSVVLLVLFVVILMGFFQHLAARIREILENVGLAQESLPSSVVGSAQVLASVANLLNIRDTELSRYVLLENIVLLWIHLDFEIMY